MDSENDHDDVYDYEQDRFLVAMRNTQVYQF